MADAKLFHDRIQAGRELATHLASYREQKPIVIGLPRGGVPVAYEVAHALGAPLDTCIVRKVGAPDQPELGVGAVAENGEVFIDRQTMEWLGVSEEAVAEIVRRRTAEVAERARAYRANQPPVDVLGRLVILVDDGVATGATARAALRAIRKRHPLRLVLAVPVGAAGSLAALRPEADDIVCPWPQRRMRAVGEFYQSFDATSDAEVVALVHRAQREATNAAGSAEGHDVTIKIGGVSLTGRLVVPQVAGGVVLFAQGNGSSHASPGQQFVASNLQHWGLATLLLDLLTAHEESTDARTALMRFDIGMLAHRLITATNWVRGRADVGHLPIGYFGATTGAAAALAAAAAQGHLISAVVSRDGQLDLAEPFLSHVSAPTLLVVGEVDHDVLRFNRSALRCLPRGKLIVVPGATPLFQQPRALERVSELAGAWFLRHLAAREHSAAL